MRLKITKLSPQGNFTPAFAKPMLYAVLFIQCVCKYAGEMREIYSFLALAKRGKGNALFVFSLVEALDKIQNVHFPLRRAFFFVF